ncbi:hypothetical protein GUITHDRAFT_46749, partial [Guillardia theta CCMP2712]
KKHRPGSFPALGIEDSIAKALMHAGYKFPTPVQRKSIPELLSGANVVMMARTGSGKTAAFLVPLIQRIRAISDSNWAQGKVIGIQGLVLVPTRELALQTFNFFKSYAKYTQLTACLIVGGEALEPQFAALATNPNVVIATPGRLLQLLNEVRTFSLKGVRVCVLDEADRLFETSLIQSERAVKKKPFRQMILVSATMPKELADFASADVQDHILIRLDTDTLMSESLKVGYFYVLDYEKLPGLAFLLSNILDTTGNTTLPCLIFCATRHSVELITQVLGHAGFQVGGLHGHADNEQRKILVEDFAKKRLQVLVVTDLAARGIDIPLLDYVINFDFPSTPKLFIHRCGRAGRAGMIGTVYSLITPEDLPHLIDANLVLGRKMRTTP